MKKPRHREVKHFSQGGGVGEVLEPRIGPSNLTPEPAPSTMYHELRARSGLGWERKGLPLPTFPIYVLFDLLR